MRSIIPSWFAGRRVVNLWQAGRRRTHLSRECRDQVPGGIVFEIRHLDEIPEGIEITLVPRFVVVLLQWLTGRVSDDAAPGRRRREDVRALSNITIPTRPVIRRSVVCESGIAVGVVNEDWEVGGDTRCTDDDRRAPGFATVLRNRHFEFEVLLYHERGFIIEIGITH